MAAAVLAVIPARYASSRFPGKPLALIAGRPMIQHVYERVKSADAVDAVVVATDDERIRAAVQAFGGTVVMTNPAAATGTDRVAEVARGSEAQVIVNVQGDEPLVHPAMVDQVAAYLKAHAAVPMASLMRRRCDAEGKCDPNVVKVVVDRLGAALYFSRAPIAHVRADQAAAAQQADWFQHVGLYGYQRDFLLRFAQLPQTPLAQAEQLEQLRALEHGYRIHMLETPHTLIGVDTPADIAVVEALFMKQALDNRGRTR
jgi:3-deoxy-manno-octulosonate cytidylyltransferase (CMP-KDO synthetase)